MSCKCLSQHGPNPEQSCRDCDSLRKSKVRASAEHGNFIVCTEKRSMAPGQMAPFDAKASFCIRHKTIRVRNRALCLFSSSASFNMRNTSHPKRSGLKTSLYWSSIVNHQTQQFNKCRSERREPQLEILIVSDPGESPNAVHHRPCRWSSGLYVTWHPAQIRDEHLA